MSAARSLGNLGNQNALKVDTTNLKVGIVSTSPVGELSVGAAITMGSASGIISATKFVGDGSDLEGVASAGLGTALSSVKTEANNLIYYTNSVLGIGSTMVIDPPSTTNVAYTQYTDIDITENCDLIVADGDDFVPDVLGLSTAGISNMSGAGGRIRAGQLVNNAGSGAPQLPYGVEIPVGYALTGAGNINVGGAATITGNLTVGGTITYENLTNQDVLGIATYRQSLYVGSIEGSGTGAGITMHNTGNAVFAGILTASTFSGAWGQEDAWLFGS